LKPTYANSSQDPIRKYLTQKGLVEWLKIVGPEFKHRYLKKKKKKKRKRKREREFQFTYTIFLLRVKNANHSQTTIQENDFSFKTEFP
jgi:hypothetical protein